MKTALLVMISCEDAAEAEHISRDLLKKHLAACTQIINRADSSFLWPPGKDNIDMKQEALLFIKTLDSKWAELEQAVKKIHSYQNPEIVGIPISHVSKTYLSWLEKELS